MMLDSWNNAYGFGFVITSDGTVYAVQEFIID